MLIYIVVHYFVLKKIRLFLDFLCIDVKNN
jgi:hypothetical protein